MARLFAPNMMTLRLLLFRDIGVLKMSNVTNKQRYDNTGLTLTSNKHLQYNRICPLLEEWLDRINSGTAQKTATAVGFLKLLRSLRAIFLQDPVCMSRRFPNHFIWHHVIFEHPLYKCMAPPLCNCTLLCPSLSKS